MTNKHKEVDHSEMMRIYQWFSGDCYEPPNMNDLMDNVKSIINECHLSRNDQAVSESVIIANLSAGIKSRASQIKQLEAEIAASTCAECTLPARVAEYQRDNTNLRIQRKEYRDATKDKNDAIHRLEERIERQKKTIDDLQFQHPMRYGLVDTRDEEIKSLRNRIERQKRTIEFQQYDLLKIERYAQSILKKLDD